MNHPATFALTGNPNSGKTTLFNLLTGLRQKVGNYPGVTVERKTGTLVLGDRRMDLIDLPGTYSLSPKSEEERIAAEVVAGVRDDLPTLQGVVCVVDATNLERSLYLVLQILDAKVPAVVALNMMDEVQHREGALDVKLLARLLRVPVFPISARTGDGLEALKAHLLEWADHPTPPSKRAAHLLETPKLREIQDRQIQATSLSRSVTRQGLKPHPWTDRVDRWVLHPVVGPLLFLFVVLLVFQSIFTWAQPLMSGMDWIFTGLGNLINSRFPDTMLRNLMVDGVIAGVGGVLVFLPQILILFFFIGLLEHTGYMARAAFVMDKFMSGIGLQGKSFLPLLSSYACAVPGIMATRTIENRRDRIATLFIAPFMTCSARLPVYTLLIGAFVPSKPLMGEWIGLQATVLLGLYAMGFLAAVVTAALLKSTFLKSDQIPFIMEIPPYRLPSIRTLLLLMWDRSKLFVVRAGTVILGVSILLWFLLAFPRPAALQDIQTSYAGMIGTFLEPALKPLGFDWRIGVGLVSAQAAREVIIATLSTIYRVGAAGEEGSLREAIQAHVTPLTAVSLMVWFAFALQCTSTLAVARRETGGWRWPMAMLVYMTGMAYLCCLMVFQGGKALGF